jgi:capsid assembly protease
MSFHYERYLSHVAGLPWAITPEKLTVLYELARFRAMGNRLSDEDIGARLALEDDERRQAPAPTRDGAIAVLPVVGVIAHRGDSFAASSGGTSTQRIGAYLQRAVSDDSVKAILLDISSPGGSIEGVPELALQMFAARKVKPIVASVNADACSAAYWLAAQCHEINITPSGRAGSIGVYMVLIDETKWLEKEGIKVNAISAGDNKLEGAPWQELSDESRAHFQSSVDGYYRDFKAAVARGRGVTVAHVEKNFGKGRSFDAQQALEIGLVDKIETFDQTLTRLVKQKPAGGTGARASTKPTVPGAAASEQIPDDEKCPTCGGSGLKPERFMSDPQGQEDCDACGGSGRMATITERADMPVDAAGAKATRDALDLL